jgi:putative oxidoreductase
MVHRPETYAAIPLRIALGVIFLAHGAQKLFGWLGGSGLESTAGFLAAHGLAPGPFWALVAAIVEIGGGLGLLLGFATRWAAAALTIRTLVALVLVHAAAGFPARRGGVEIPLALLGGLLTLIITGAQRFSLDAALPAPLGATAPVHTTRTKVA